jgi:Na+/proline symporter
MLTAENPTKARLSLILSGFADIPIVLAFLAVGILLWVHYQIQPDASLPPVANEVFAHYIVHEMPVGIRGLIIAGVFATMMGSTSAALNALATSFIRDFYQPYIRPAASEREVVSAARWATSVFGGCMVVVATGAAYAVLETNITIIPLALGILGYSYGALLGVFLLGVLSKSRGNDRANVVAMLLGIAAVLVLCKVKIPAFGWTDGHFGPMPWNFGGWMPEGWPAISWPYFVLIGSTVTIAVAMFFRSETPAHETPREDSAGSGDEA